MIWTLQSLLSLFCLAIIVVALAHRLLSSNSANIWAKLETVGLPSRGIFPWTRAIVDSVKAIQRNARDGYENVCKAKGLPFVLPTIWTGGAVVVLPPSQLPLLNRPDSELSTFQGLLETLQLPYMISDPQILGNLLQFDVIRKKLTNKDVISSLAAVTAEEIEIGFCEYWGSSKDWKTVNGWDACESVIMRATLRTLVGLPLCRDEALLKESRMFVNSLFVAAGTINCLPPFLRPLVGPILALPVKYHQYRYQRILVPFVEERLRAWKELGADKMPNDFLHWLIQRCADAEPEQMEASRISMRILTISTMFIWAIAYVFSYSVLDLYGSSPASKSEFMAGLEEECKRISTKYHGLSTKEAIDSLYRVDSTIRESMRMANATGITSFPLEVVSGQVNIGNGIYIPPGVRMVFPTHAIHLDPDNYKEPMYFDALRFSRPFEDSKDSDKRDLVGVAHPSETFLGFGYGRRHGCPGRWFAAQIIKQGLAHIVLNYDVEVIGGPVERKFMLMMILPPTDVKMRIRRKE